MNLFKHKPRLIWRPKKQAPAVGVVAHRVVTGIPGLSLSFRNKTKARAFRKLLLESVQKIPSTIQREEIDPETGYQLTNVKD